MSPVKRFLINFIGESWLSHVVCTSLYCVRTAAIFGVMYCKMEFVGHAGAVEGPEWDAQAHATLHTGRGAEDTSISCVR